MIYEWTAILTQLVEWVARNRILLLLAACMALGAMGAWLIASVPYRERLLDLPGGRSSHTEPTPRGGGVGILAAFIVAGITLHIPATFLFAVIFLSAVSFYGDFLRISIKFRLLVQFISALVCLFPLLPRLNAQYALSVFGLPPFVFFLILFLPLIFLFLIGTANFYNFMDGINGIAGITGIIGWVLIALYYFQFLHVSMTPVSEYAVLAACIAFSCLGFLPFNMPKARVFMGDVGSILLGFVFAAVIVRLSGNYLDLICMASFLFVFYADELTTMWVRLRNREKLTRPHRRHLYQLLANEFKMPHWKVTMLYGLVQLLAGMSVIFIRRYGFSAVFLLLAAYFLIFALISFYFRRKLSLIN
jgi:Fuc2NAc and GlcNAc transferase